MRRRIRRVIVAARRGSEAGDPERIGGRFPACSTERRVALSRWLPTTTVPHDSRPACSTATWVRTIRPRSAASRTTPLRRSSRACEPTPTPRSCDRLVALHRRARHRRDRRALVAGLRQEPARRAVARVPAAHAHPAGSARHQPRLPARHRGLAHDRPGRRGRSDPHGPGRGHRARRPHPARAVRGRLRRRAGSRRRLLRGSSRPASRASPTMRMPRTRPIPIARVSSPSAPCASRSSPTSSRRARDSGGATRSTELARRPRE